MATEARMGPNRVAATGSGETHADLPHRLVLASANRDKAAVLEHALGGLLPVVLVRDVLTPSSSAWKEIDDSEDGPTMRAIAGAKACRWAVRFPGEMVVATDGGLLIPALGAAWVPARTRRFAGEWASNAERVAALLALTRDLRAQDRRVGWREALAVARNGSLLATWEAEATPGLLAANVAPAFVPGDNFWLPALWCCPEFGGRRLADLSPAEQAARDDHWARLGTDLRHFLAPQGDGSR